MSPKSISVVLPNYNGEQLLEDNLPSLYDALRIFGLEYKVIVVDDCSTDRSIYFLESKYPDITILKNAINLGFSPTCNRGIQFADGDLVCVANTDVSFHPDYFRHALDHLNKKNVFAVKGDIINYAGQRDKVINIDKTTRLYFKRGFLRFRTDRNFGDKPFDLEYVGLGCCFIANTTHIQKLGGFDTIFSPYYWEDSDIALSALEAGYELIYEPKSIVYHKASSTMEKTESNLKRKVISNRNKFLFCWKHLKGRKRWTIHIVFLFFSLFSRFLILDWKFYYAFTLAIIRKIRFGH